MGRGLNETLRKVRTGIVLLIVVSVIGVGWWQVKHLKATAGADGGDRAHSVQGE